jgi:hypothetical protein
MRNTNFLKIVAIFVMILSIKEDSHAQLFPRFSVAGGPTVGWHTNNTDDLNSALRQIGIPELDKGFLTLGGGGFVDLPFKGFDKIRVGGFGNGFSASESATVNGLKAAFRLTTGSVLQEFWILHSVFNLRQDLWR